MKVKVTHEVEWEVEIIVDDALIAKHLVKVAKELGFTGDATLAELVKDYDISSIAVLAARFELYERVNPVCVLDAWITEYDTQREVEREAQEQ